LIPSEAGRSEPGSVFRERLRGAAAWSVRNRRRLIAAAALLALGFWLARSCVPGLGENLLPVEVVRKITAHYQTCIGIDETAIWPGEPRQPGCGTVEVRPLGRGVVPAEEAAAGTTQVVCYQVRMNNPSWSTLGQTRHELVWSERTVYRVAILQEGEWALDLGREGADEERWSRYACPDRPAQPDEESNGAAAPRQGAGCASAPRPRTDDGSILVTIRLNSPSERRMLQETQAGAALAAREMVGRSAAGGAPSPALPSEGAKRWGT